MSLLALPIEIRQEIYAYLLTTRGVLNPWQKRIDVDVLKLNLHLAILGTCTAVREEAIGLLLGRNYFVYKIPRDESNEVEAAEAGMPIPKIDEPLTVVLPWTGIKHLRLRYMSTYSRSLVKTLSSVARECQLDTLELDLWFPWYVPDNSKDLKSVFKALLRVGVSQSIDITAEDQSRKDDVHINGTRATMASLGYESTYNITAVPLYKGIEYLEDPRGRWVLVPKK